MEKRELAFTKQAILATKDWDAYRVMIRRCLRIAETTPKPLDKTAKL